MPSFFVMHSPIIIKIGSKEQNQQKRQHHPKRSQLIFLVPTHREQRNQQNYLQHDSVNFNIIIHMPWFESSKEKQLRLLIEDKLKICITRPNQYQNGFSILESYVRKPNQKVIEMIVDHIKKVIKDDDIDAKQKYQAMVLLRDLMQTHSKYLGKYVAKKILKRLTIFAEDHKQSKDEKRGRDIFSTREKQPEYAQKFINILLLSIEEWGKKWPKSADGPHQEFNSAYNELLMQKGVQFPIKPQEPTGNRASLPKSYRNSVDDKKSPAKISGAISPRNIQNAPTQPVVKQKAPLAQDVSQYFQKIISILTSFSSTLDQNKEFNDMWEVIKDIVNELKNVIRQGDAVMAGLLQKGESEQTEELVQQINDLFQFLTDLEKDTGIIDRKSQKYNIYNKKYLKKCKKIITSLEKDMEGSKKNNFSNQNVGNKGESSKSFEAQGETSMGRRVEQQQKLEVPRIQHKNQYNSTNDLKRQLELNINQIKKEDFNSNNHRPSEGSDSSRHNSFAGKVEKQNRNSGQASPDGRSQAVKEEEKQMPTKQKYQQQEEQSPSFPQKQKMNKFQEIRRQQTGISKITQKNQSQSQIPASGNEFQDFSEIKKEKSAKNDEFSNFQIPSEVKEENEDSNSDFFKEKQVQNKEQKNNNAMIVPRKLRRGPTLEQNTKNQAQNPFDISVKSKVSSEGLSAFAKSKSNVKSNQKFQSSKKMDQGSFADKSQAPKFGFDTFKSPDDVNQAFQEINKSKFSKRSNAESEDDPFESKFSRKQLEKPRRDSIDNIFSSRVRDNIQNEPKDDPFATDQENYDASNPFKTTQKDSHNIFQSNLGGDENPFESKIGVEEFEDPLASKVINKYAEPRESNNIFSSQYNPSISKNQGQQIMSGKFYTGGRSSQNRSSQKSESSFPFPDKNKIQKSFNGSDSSFPGFPPKRQSQNENPFQNKSQKSINSNPFEKQTEKDTQKSIQYPFDKNQNEDPFDLTRNNEVNKNEKSLSKHESFKDIGKLKGVRKVSMEDPFDQKQSKSDSRSQNSDKNEFNNGKHANDKFKDSFQFEVPADPRNSVRNSEFGFNFDDFDNMSRNKSQSNKGSQKGNKSGFDFDDFDGMNDVPKKDGSFADDDFFAKQSKRGSIEQKSQNSDFFNQNYPQNKPRQSQKSQKNSFTDFFKGDNKSSQERQSQSQQKRNSLKEANKIQFNFDDFQNHSQSKSRQSSENSQSKKLDNPFGGFQSISNSITIKVQKKESIQAGGIQWDKFGNISQQASNHENSKVMIEEPQQMDEVRESEIVQKHFDQIPWNKAQSQQSSEREAAEEINYKISINSNQPLSKNVSISPIHDRQAFIHPQEISPFQKKQVRWDGTLGVLPSTNRYNISNDQVDRKKREVEEKKRLNGEKLRKYQELKDFQQNLKKKYKADLEKVVEARLQKKQFIALLKRLKQMNEVKEKDIEEMMKKTKKAEELKAHILEKQRLLYDRMKQQSAKTEKKVNFSKTVGNKWERFNQNLEKLRENDANMTRNYQSAYSIAYNRAY